MLETLLALAEPNRLLIVELLRQGARPVGEIAESLKLNQPQVSKHLRVLREAGLVGAEVRAQQRFYELRPEPLRELDEWLGRFRQIWGARLERLDGYLEHVKKQRARPRK